MKDFRLNGLERSIIYLLAALHTLVGLYLVSPFYVQMVTEGKTPLYLLLSSRLGVGVFGVMVLVNGLLLLYAVVRSGRTLRLTKRYLGYTLFTGFLLRLYSATGVMIAAKSVFPPTYLPTMLTVVLFGIMWLWVTYNERPTK